MALECVEHRRHQNLVAALLEGAGGRIFAFGASHSSLPVQDIVYRAGGLMFINPLYGPGIEALTTRPTTLGSQMEQMPGFGEVLFNNSPLKEGDVLIDVSVSGHNAVPVELARAARENGVFVVGLTSHKYTDAVTSRVPDGTKLKDHADIVIDNRVDAGDVVLSLDGGAEWNAKYMAENADRIFYLN